MMDNVKFNKLPTTEGWFRRHLTKWQVERINGQYLKFRVPRLNYFKPFTLRNKSNENIFRVHYTSDPDLIWSMLSDPKNDLSLSHYDEALSNLERPISLLLGENQRQSNSWEILAKALSENASKKKGYIAHHPLNAPIDRQNTEAIEKLTQKACSYIISGLKSKKKFNIVRDYGYIIPYMVGLKFTGLREIDRIPILVKLFAILRNISLFSFGSGRLKCWSKNGSADTFLLWTAAMFLQIFGNPGNLNSVKRLVAGWGASNYYKNVEKSFANANKIATYSLLKRFSLVEANFVSDKINRDITPEEYRHMATCLLLEVMTSFHILIGISFANMWKPILESEGGIKLFADNLKAAHKEDKKNKNTRETDRVINEILSKNSTTAMLYRKARRPFPKYGIKQGDYICFRITQASKHVKGSSKWLNFGPHEKCPYSLLETGKRDVLLDSSEAVSHPCFGQFWARSVLKTMFLTLFEELPEIKPLNKDVKKFGIPEILMVATGK